MKLPRTGQLQEKHELLPLKLKEELLPNPRKEGQSLPWKERKLKGDHAVESFKRKASFLDKGS